MRFWNLCWPGITLETSTGNRHREIISSLFFRPKEISTEVLLLMWYFSCRFCSHRSSPPVPAGGLVQFGAGLTAGRFPCQPWWYKLSGWEKRPPSSPQSLQGLCVHPQGKWQKNPSDFNEASVSAYLEGALQSNSVHRVEATSCSGSKRYARRALLSCNPFLFWQQEWRGEQQIWERACLYVNAGADTWEAFPVQWKCAMPHSGICCSFCRHVGVWNFNKIKTNLTQVTVLHPWSQWNHSFIELFRL